MLNRQIEMACRGEKEVTCCVRGYHVYKGTCQPLADRYAVAVLKQETVIGHLPRNIFTTKKKRITVFCHLGQEPTPAKMQ